ncbi:Hypothetical protein PHPALM_8668 [Phytophthora palmivora]|uniref:Uncharacterized protein n=1 Tax=Phytophthora palmivora TaxID=4796 RepID=A0A2P4Y9Q3_9STRA|nr:Hypothetical protein PHPALM_8668 [Phytophthora palmivora]
MMYDPDLYLPVWYVLTSGKTSQIYEHRFEFAMIKADTDSRIVGCFHFKQVLRRKMTEWWNGNSLNEDNINRIKNPLERYNRTLNDAFSVPHPDVVGMSQLGTNGCC